MTSKRILRSLLWILLMAFPLSGTLQAIDDEQRAKIDRFLQRHLDETPVPGFSAVVVEGGRIVFQKGYGTAVIGGATAITADSPIAIGSQTKSFTAFAVLQLVEQGRVDLDAPVTRYLPWFDTADRRGSEITIRMLLHNTSGLPSRDRWLTSSNRSESAMEKSVRALSVVSLVRTPGQSFEYANENWTVLGVVIQEVTGLAFSEYLERYVLEPMGMHHSTTALDRFDELEVLYGHDSGIDRVRPARPRFLAEALPAGSELRASAGDMGRYLITLLEGGRFEGREVLSGAGVDLLFSPGVVTDLFVPEMGAFGGDVGYAMGWVQTEAEGRTVHHHGGDAITMGSWTMLDREAGVGASLLYNGPLLDVYRFPTKVWVVHNLLRLTRGLPLSDIGLPADDDPTRNDYELPEELLARYVGEYVSADGLRARISASEAGSRLIFQQRAGVLDALSELDFASESTVVLRNLSEAAVADFRLTPGGQVTGFEGGVSGGPYRRRPDDQLARLQDVRAPDGSIALRLPRSWSWAWRENSIVAANPNEPEQRLRISLATDSWESRREQLARSSSQEPVSRTETIGPWLWQSLLWQAGVGEDARQHLVASTDIEGLRLEVDLSVESGQLSAAVREVLLPVFADLEVQPAP